MAWRKVRESCAVAAITAEKNRRMKLRARGRLFESNVLGMCIHKNKAMERRIRYMPRRSEVENHRAGGDYSFFELAGSSGGVGCSARGFSRSLPAAVSAAVFTCVVVPFFRPRRSNASILSG